VKLGLNCMRAPTKFGAWGLGPQPNVEMVQHAEQLGYDSIWTSEGTGTDAIVPLAWLAAHTNRVKLGTAAVQMTARAPASTATTAVTLDQLSGGRLVLGVGASGPQVVEGLHGQPFGQPLERTREYVTLLRSFWARRGPVTHEGRHYQVPYRGSDGLGMPAISLSVRPPRPRIPIYLAAMGPRNTRLAAEIADGMIPLFTSPYQPKILTDHLSAAPAHFDVAPMVTVVVGDDLDACFDKIRPALAFMLGGMGTREMNFYNRLASRMGYEDAMSRVHDLYLDGKRPEAEAAVPAALIDEINLCGPRERIRERLEPWLDSPVTTMILSADREAIELMAELAL
jgi:F420-dependent oxidoreductase-like protein